MAIWGKSKSFAAGIWKWALTHKFLATVGFVILLTAGYYSYNSLHSANAETRYVLSPATRGDLIVSVSASGQVSAKNQIELKPQASGNVSNIYVTEGQTVKSGTLLLQLDSTNAQKTVRDARLSLENAQLSLQKLQSNPDAANTTLASAYDSGFNELSSTFLNLPGIMTGLNNNMFTGSTSLGGTAEWNADFYYGVASQYGNNGTEALALRQDLTGKYQIAQTAYNQAFSDYQAASRASDNATIDTLVEETYNTSKDISDALKSATNLIQFYENTLTNMGTKYNPYADIQISTLSGYASQINASLTALLSAQSSIQSAKDNITGTGLDLKSAQLAVEQAQNSLADAQSALADYSVRAPFSGTVAKINVQKGDSAGPSASAITFITQQQLATVSLNEVDVSKVKVGDKVNMTFDAVDGLTITGEVVDVDTIGTVTQGVVTYNVTISFDVQDPRVKSGMSVNAVIITQVDQNVLTVPSSAVKSQGGINYVETLDGVSSSSAQNSAQGITSAVPPNQIQVEVGNSNDTETEITSGLNEGDEVVSRTITAAAQTTTQAPSLFGGSGARTTTGGASRAGGGGVIIGR